MRMRVPPLSQLCRTELLSTSSCDPALPLTVVSLASCMRAPAAPNSVWRPAQPVRPKRPHLVDGGVDLDVNIVANLVGAQVGGQGDVPMVPEPTRERVARPRAQTSSSRHCSVLLTAHAAAARAGRSCMHGRGNCDAACCCMPPCCRQRSLLIPRDRTWRKGKEGGPGRVRPHVAAQLVWEM